ncbi:hypothetical protein B0T10DRAFT_581236 [Thelonectria olida]|uniref:Cell division cycle protein 123 n=1 Tax=Thelonectria olida TaxID=1576542 RepID=A0A9P8VX73_9HYPO|nr:hypothetical protein B0T10DRAFT_581236 [Thelonectria olida]
MNLHIVDFEDVRRDLDTGVPTNFNTAFHKAAEAPDLPIPTEIPTSFDRWLPLIMRTRGLPPAALQVRLLVEAAGASIHTRVMNRVYEEDLRDSVYPAFERLKFSQEGLFTRLGACSPKDGTQTIPGQMSLHSIDDIILRLTTSTRATNTFNNMLNHDAQEMAMFFLPFDSRMRTENEYRVFCAPDSLRITAVSQYKWHKPWMFAGKDSHEREAIARRVLHHIEAVHTKIIGDFQDLGSNENDDRLRIQGFTFDVLYDEETDRGELIELNTFGVRSACGSCLFQWVEDRALLYGEESEVVQFRVAV